MNEMNAEGEGECALCVCGWATLQRVWGAEYMRCGSLVQLRALGCGVFGLHVPQIPEKKTQEVWFQKDAEEPSQSHHAAWR